MNLSEPIVFKQVGVAVPDNDNSVSEVTSIDNSLARAILLCVFAVRFEMRNRSFGERVSKQTHCKIGRGNGPLKLHGLSFPGGCKRG